jgi:hypothetical protein
VSGLDEELRLLDAPRRLLAVGRGSAGRVSLEEILRELAARVLVEEAFGVEEARLDRNLSPWTVR